jgi:hypothetical protein
VNAIRAFDDATVACRLMCLLYGVSLTITFAEKWTRVRDYGPHGWFAWRVFKFDRAQFAAFRSAPVAMDRLFGPAGMSVVLGSGIAGVATMWAFSVRSVPFTVGVAITVVACLVIQSRSIYGGDGSQQMNLVIGVAVLLGFNPWVKPMVGSLSLAFVAAQSCLAYFTSGVSKVISPIWMRGEPLVGILSTTAYGSELGLRIALRAPRVTRTASFVMVGLETSFPLSVAGPLPILVGFLLWGVAFHVANAFFMGLNTFLWSFLATYPAICYVWLQLH